MQFYACGVHTLENAVIVKTVKHPPPQTQSHSTSVGHLSAAELKQRMTIMPSSGKFLRGPIFTDDRLIAKIKPAK